MSRALPGLGGRRGAATCAGAPFGVHAQRVAAPLAARPLTAAQAMYRKAGYVEIQRFNTNPYANFWFEKDLAAAD